MNERVEQIRQRLQAATPGPWRASTRLDDEIYIETGPKTASEQMCRFIGGSVYPQYVIKDATFIAHAPEDVAYLLEQLEAAQATVAELREEHITDLNMMEEHFEARLQSVKAYAEAHHEMQPIHILLHSLAVDIPAMCATRATPPTTNTTTGPGEAGEEGGQRNG